MSDKPLPSKADLCDINAARAERAAARFEEIAAQQPENQTAIGMRDFHIRDVNFWKRRSAEYREEF